MCAVCGKHVCPPSCPSYAGRKYNSGALYAVCARCSRRIYARDVSFRKSEMIFCKECYETLYFVSANGEDEKGGVCL